jgi:F420-0:gamma-glutamyl ligase-like protein
MVERALHQTEGLQAMTNPVIENIRRSLGRTAQISPPQGVPLNPRPTIYESRQPESLDAEADHLLEEVRKLSGVGQKLSVTDLDSAFKTLITEQNIHKATAWETPHLRNLGVTEILNSLGGNLYRQMPASISWRSAT